jgi:hypothetical protein
MHADSQVTTGDTEIGMLSVCRSAFVVRPEILSAMEAQVGGRLH